MSLIADVCDLNNIVSLNPLAFDMGTTFVRGATAIIYRVIYLWCTPLLTLIGAPGLGMSVPIPDLPGTTYSPANLSGLRASLISQAKQVAFVDDCDVTITPVAGGRITIAATITLTDNKAYALEVSAGAAAVAITNIGSQ